MSTEDAEARIDMMCEVIEQLLPGSKKSLVAMGSLMAVEVEKMLPGDDHQLRAEGAVVGLEVAQAIMAKAVATTIDDLPADMNDTRVAMVWMRLTNLLMNALAVSSVVLRNMHQMPIPSIDILESDRTKRS